MAVLLFKIRRQRHVATDVALAVQDLVVNGLDVVLHVGVLVVAALMVTARCRTSCSHTPRTRSPVCFRGRP